MQYGFANAVLLVARSCRKQLLALHSAMGSRSIGLPYTADAGIETSTSFLVDTKSIMVELGRKVFK
jgi:hypothetical protein